MEDVRIVLVEDDDGHATLVEKNLRRAGISNTIARMKDGQEALDHIAHQVAESPENLANTVMLLDLNMPRLGGVEVLESLKANPTTSAIPIIVLTTTDNPREVERCYELGCNVYVTKPVDYEAFVEAIRRLGFFLQVVKLPPLTARNAST
jgi:CheY-like chemotaxis protein